MSESLSDFLINLGSDPDRMARFAVDPSGALNESSLSSEERMAVMAADSGGVRRMLDAAVPGAGNDPRQLAAPGRRNGTKKNGGKRNGGKRNGAKKKAYRKGSKK